MSAYKIVCVFAVFLLAGCGKAKIIPNPKTFCKGVIKLKCARIDITSIDQTEDPQIAKFHLREQIHQWAADRFTESDYENGSVSIRIITWIKRKSHKEKKIFGVKESAAEYSIIAHVFFERLDEAGELISSFKLIESAAVDFTGDFDKSDEKTEVNQVIFELIEKLDGRAAAKINGWK